MQRLLVYPETEILIRKNYLFRAQASETGLILNGFKLQAQIDELSDWIFSHLDGNTSVTSIIDLLVTVHGDRERIAAEVRDTLTRFIDMEVTLIANQIQ